MTICNPDIEAKIAFFVAFLYFLKSRIETRLNFYLSHSQTLDLFDSFAALTVLVKNVPKAMSSWISQILPPVWSTLTSSADKYVKEVVNDSGDEGEEVVDSDGEVLDFENLVFAIFEFVHALVETPKFRVAVKSGLSDLIYYIVLYMQITHEQVKLIFLNFLILMQVLNLKNSSVKNGAQILTNLSKMRTKTALPTLFEFQPKIYCW